MIYHSLFKCIGINTVSKSLSLIVKVIPNSKQTKIQKIEHNHILMNIKEDKENNKANRAVCVFFNELIPHTDFIITKGNKEPKKYLISKININDNAVLQIEEIYSLLKRES